mgnify:CR=1 FL=1
MNYCVYITNEPINFKLYISKTDIKETVSKIKQNKVYRVWNNNIIGHYASCTKWQIHV